MALRWMIVFVYATNLIISNTYGKEIVPCYFIFGDSLVDNGNNNDLKTTAKANYLPYGIDFPDGPTGRFTNGLNVPDFIANYLGFEKYIPAAAAVTGKDSEIILKGVNYGSGSAGIRQETASHMGDCISMEEQLQNHEITISRIASLLGNQSAANKYLNKCLYTINIGNNDYINNYLLPQYYNTSKLYTPNHYATLLVNQYSLQIKALQVSGARKIAIFGLGPIGCCPQMLNVYGKNDTGCVDWINDAVQFFNQKLKSLVTTLNSDLTSPAKYTFIDIFTIQSLNPASIGLKYLNQPCCKVITENVTQAGQCIPLVEACMFRALNLFFDNFHPTEVVNIFTSFRAYYAPFPSDAYPISIHELAKLSV